MHKQLETQNTAVLFFSRSPKAEGKSKQLAHHSCDQNNTRIAEALIRHTRRQITNSGLPCFIFDEVHQQGSTFVERFTHAFESVFAEGFKHVIATGNDTPGLKAAHITSAARKLTSGKSDVVLGPTTDRGTWLMGYSRHPFDANAFRQLPWNSQDLLDELLSQSPKISQFS